MGQMLKTWMKWKHNFLIGFYPSSCCTRIRNIPIVFLCVLPLFVQLVTVQGIQTHPSDHLSLAYSSSTNSNRNSAKVLTTQSVNAKTQNRLLPPATESHDESESLSRIGSERLVWSIATQGPGAHEHHKASRVKGESAEPVRNGGQLGPLRIFKYVTGDEEYSASSNQEISSPPQKEAKDNRNKAYHNHRMQSGAAGAAVTAALAQAAKVAAAASSSSPSSNLNANKSVHTDPKSYAVTDRSLIPNSFFASAANNKKNESNYQPDQITSESTIMKKTQGHKNAQFVANGIIRSGSPDESLENATPKSNEVFINGTISERPRRSPFHRFPPTRRKKIVLKGPRAPLYHRGGHPNAPGARIPVPMHSLQPPLRQQQQNYPQLPVPVAYTGANAEYQSPASDFFHFGEQPTTNTQEPSFNNMMFSKRPNGAQSRRNPQRRGRPNAAVGQGLPLPRPMRHPPRSRSKRPRPSKNSPYHYPKNAENIQDILSFFDKENEVDGPGPRGKRPGPPNNGFHHHGPDLGIGHGHQAPPSSASSDFSKELRDVQSSLLKDIREFAKRPVLMNQDYSSSQMENPPPSPSSSSTREVNDDHHMDDPYEPAPKPVRDMIKMGSRHRDADGSRESYYKAAREKPRERERERDRERERERERPRERDRELMPPKNRMRYQPPFVDEESKEKERLRDDRSRNRPNRHSNEKYRDRSKEERFRDSHRDHRDSNSNGGTRSKGNKYREDGYSVEDHERYKDFPSSYRPRDSDEYRKGFSKDPYAYRSTHKPVVLKRPFESRPLEIDAPKRRPEHDYYWNLQNSRNGDSREGYSNRQKVSSTYNRPIAGIPTYPIGHYAYARPVTRVKPHLASPEVEEDIVEIHTGGMHHSNPHGNPNFYHDLALEKERDKHLHMQKMYMDFLAQKTAEAQAALLGNGHGSHHVAPKKKSPMRMKIHIYPNEAGSESTISSTVVNPGPNNNYGMAGYPSNPPSMIAPASNKPQVYAFNPNSNPHRTIIIPQSAGPVPPTPPHYGMNDNHQQSSSGMGVDKNKNVVLHLHVHRRNGGGAELEAEASQVHPVSVKPLSYNMGYRDIYEEHDEDQQHHHHQEEPQPAERVHDKSVSMEVPIHDDKIDDVLQTLLKLREKQEEKTEENNSN